MNLELRVKNWASRQMSTTWKMRSNSTNSIDLFKKFFNFHCLQLLNFSNYLIVTIDPGEAYMVRGHSTTTWTEFYHFLPPTPTVFWMGFYADISWESRCSSEIKVWGHWCQIFVVFEVPARPLVKRMSGNS